MGNAVRNTNSHGGMLLCAQRRKIDWKTRMKMIKPILSLGTGKGTFESVKKNKREI